jgi:cobyrinic acid a,c-diamide synthase
MYILPVENIFIGHPFHRSSTSSERKSTINAKMRRYNLRVGYEREL